MVPVVVAVGVIVGLGVKFVGVLVGVFEGAKVCVIVLRGVIEGVDVAAPTAVRLGVRVLVGVRVFAGRAVVVHVFVGVGDRSGVEVSVV